MLAFVDGILLKNEVEAPPPEKISIYKVTNVPNIISGFSFNNGRTTPKSFHDATTPIENLAGFIISHFLQTSTFAKYWSTLMVPLLQYSIHLLTN